MLDMTMKLVSSANTPKICALATFLTANQFSNCTFSVVIQVLISESYLFCHRKVVYLVHNSI